MDGISGKVDGVARFYKVVKSDPELGRKIPDTCPAGLAVRDKDIRRIFVGRVDESACTLHPRDDTTAGTEIPAKDDRRDADAGEGSTAIREDHMADLALELILGEHVMGRGCERLPIGHDFARVLELAAQDAGKMRVGEHLAGAYSG